jgi:hypothetical protein
VIAGRPLRRLALVLALSGAAASGAGAAGSGAGAAEATRALALGWSAEPGVAAVGRALAAELDGPALPSTAVTGRPASDSRRLLAALRAGRIDIALVRADALAQAAQGHGAFADTTPDSGLRSIARLFDLPLHLVVPAGAPAARAADLAGARIAVAPPGAARLGLVRALLDTSAGAPTDRRATLSAMAPGAALQALRAGRVDALAMAAAAPADPLAEALGSGALRLLPVAGPTRRRLARTRAGVAPAAIPAAAYGLGSALDTVGVGLVLTARRPLDDPSAYRIADAVWAPALARRLAAGPGRRARLHLAQALGGLPVPLHAGAISWYQRRGFLP